MAKDPAFLFYSNDFLTGIQDLTMEERGQYITLLCIQHQKGHLTEKMISLSCGNAAADVLAKFEKDSEGKFFNKRLDEEIGKRREHTDKQRKRAIEGWKKRKENDATALTTANATALPLENENENENINENNKKRSASKKNPCDPPSEKEVKKYASENGYNPDFMWEKMRGYIGNGMRDSHGNPILNWKLKMNQVWFKPEHKILNNSHPQSDYDNSIWENA